MDLFLHSAHLEKIIRSLLRSSQVMVLQKASSQLIVKAIILLEDAGAYVDAIVCDGAATDRSYGHSLV